MPPSPFFSSSASPSTSHPNPSHPQQPQLRMPAKQRMAVTFKSLASRFLGGSGGDAGPPPMTELFPKTDPAVDGDDCLHDCDSCAVHYPRGFKIDEEDLLYGHVKGWSTHVIVGTSKTDWVRDVADEKGSVMEAIGKAGSPTNGRMMLSASNMPTPNDTNDYSEPTTVLLLPAFTLIHNVHPSNVPRLITDLVSIAPTTNSPLSESFSALPPSLPSPSAGVPGLTTARCPHSAVILMCSQRTRDARCGQSAPLLRKELERHLRPLGLHRDLHDDRPGGVGIYFISHVGGHKYSANVMVYRRPNAFGLDDVPDDETVDQGKSAATDSKDAGDGQNGTTESADVISNGKGPSTSKDQTSSDPLDAGASQCIWLARVKPDDCENLVRYTVLRGKVVKPERQLRGGFDRGKGLMSW